MGILSLLAPLLPWLFGALAVLIGYFTIRQRGVAVERAKWEKAEVKAEEKLKENVKKAESKDEAIDAAVEAKIEEIKEQNTPPAPSGDIFKF
jgi:molybdopterin synthase catalytic subunit